MATREFPASQPRVSWFDTCLVTAYMEIRRTLAYRIEVVRWPVWPTMYFVTLLITYSVADRGNVNGISPEAFLLVGTWGMALWSSAIWTSGYAIERERREGTILSLFLSPASRGAVIFGYAAGSLLVFVIPTMLIVAGVALISGAEFNISDPLAVAASAFALVGSAVMLGYMLAGAFVLSRRANMIANFLQSPIFLLSGMVVPVDDLPGPLQFFAEIFPISAGMEALRASLLRGASFSDVAPDLVRVLILAIVLAIMGFWLIRRVEHVAKRGDQLDFD